MSIKYNVIIQKEENWYVVKCIDNSISLQGKAIEEALELYMQDGEQVKPKEIFITTLEVAV